FASLGNAGNNQNASQRWSFLPPLQKPGQGNGQTGLQSNPFNSVWQPNNSVWQPKTQGQPTQGQPTQGQSHSQLTMIPGNTGQSFKATGQGNNNQRFSNLPPPQKQPQTSRNGQATNSLNGYQGTSTWNGQQNMAIWKGQQGTVQ